MENNNQDGQIKLMQALLESFDAEITILKRELLSYKYLVEQLKSQGAKT